MEQLTVLYLCPLGQQHQQWRLAAAPPELNVIMRRNPSRHELIALMPQADVLITERTSPRTGMIDREIIDAGAETRLKLIQRVGSLCYDIDLAAARERGVPVALRPIRGVVAVAEHVMMQMLALLRQAMPLQQVVRTPPESFSFRPPGTSAQHDVPFTPRRTNEDVFAFNWSGQKQVGLLYHKTVGILGFGEIGAELARRLVMWECRVLYSKRSRLPAETEQELNIEYREQEALLLESDIVVCLLPYFPETDLWLNVQRIAMMKRGALLCHAGSGSVIDEQAVTDAVHGGHLAGAAFDTFEWEPIKQDNPLLRLADNDPHANIFLTPHIGACNDIPASEFPEFYANALRVLRGEPVEGRVA
jgi:phosphoglycerate dehydrogenase-like enzyme